MMLEQMDCDLHRVIQSKQSLSLRHHKFFLRQILEAVKAMHDIGVFHRDLKPGNILVSKDCQVRITDFGLARYMHESTRSGMNSLNPMTEYVVTRWYRCPELLLAPNRPYDEAIDLWSVGCILAELLRRKPLFPGKSHPHQVQLIFELIGFSHVSELGFELSNEATTFMTQKCRFPGQSWATIIPTNLDPTGQALSLLRSLLTVNPKKRPSAAQALQSLFLQDSDTLVDYSTIQLQPPPSDYFDFEHEMYDLNSLKRMIQQEVQIMGKLSYEVNPAMKSPFATSMTSPPVPSSPSPAQNSQVRVGNGASNISEPNGHGIISNNITKQGLLEATPSSSRLGTDDSMSEGPQSQLKTVNRQDIKRNFDHSIHHEDQGNHVGVTDDASKGTSRSSASNTSNSRLPIKSSSASSSSNPFANGRKIVGGTSSSITTASTASTSSTPSSSSPPEQDDSLANTSEVTSSASHPHSIGAVLAYARSVNARSPLPRTAKVPSPQQVQAIQSKDVKVIHRLQSQQGNLVGTNTSGASSSLLSSSAAGLEAAVGRVGTTLAMTASSASASTSTASTTTTTTGSGLSRGHGGVKIAPLPLPQMQHEGTGNITGGIAGGGGGGGVAVPKSGLTSFFQQFHASKVGGQSISARDRHSSGVVGVESNQGRKVSTAPDSTSSASTPLSGLENPFPNSNNSGSSNSNNGNNNSSNSRMNNSSNNNSYYNNYVNSHGSSGSSSSSSNSSQGNHGVSGNTSTTSGNAASKAKSFLPFPSLKKGFGQ